MSDLEGERDRAIAAAAALEEHVARLEADSDRLAAALRVNRDAIMLRSRRDPVDVHAYWVTDDALNLHDRLRAEA